MTYLEVLGQNALCIPSTHMFWVVLQLRFCSCLPTPNKLIRCFRFVILISQTMSSFCYTAQPFALVHETASALVHGDEIALVHADDKVELQHCLAVARLALVESAPLMAGQPLPPVALRVPTPLMPKLPN